MLIAIGADVPQNVPAKIKNAKRRKIAKVTPVVKPQKKPKLPEGAPSTELSVWTEAEMAVAVKHLQTCDPREALIHLFIAEMS